MPVRTPSGNGPSPRRALLAAALVLVAGAGTLFGRNIYVDGFSGSPGNDGTASFPLDTIQAAVDLALAGDQVIVAPWTYQENVVIVGRPVDMLAPGGPFVTTIDGGGLDSVLLLDQAADSRIIGFRITNGLATFGGGIEVIGGNPEISHCMITGNGALTDAFGYGGLGGGVDTYLAHGVTVRDSLITGNSAEIGGGGVNVGFSNFAVVSFNTIVGNTTTGPSTGYGSGVHVVYGGGQQVTNNIFDGNAGSMGTGGLEVYQAGVTIVGNIFHANTPADFVSTECISPPCPVPDENQVADPRFVDPGSGNYRLRLDSPGIDVSDPNVPPSTVDLDQNARPVDSDMDGVAVPEPGCFEHLGGITGVGVAGGGLVTWDSAPGPPDAYHVYRSTALAVTLGDYGTCQDGRDPDPGDTQFVETDDPPPGEVFTFLVSFTRNGAESSLGLASDGVARTVAAPCP